MERLKISENQRFLVKESGEPFFWLGDTAWELFHRLTIEEVEQYFDNRVAKGFTIIQCVVLAEIDGLHTPNMYGHTPLYDDDPTKPNEDYFKHVDAVIELAAKKGLYLALLPTWGDKVKLVWGVGPIIFNEENARIYGKWLAERYKDQNHIIWMLGGDRWADGYETLWQEMAYGIRKDAGHTGLITYHPRGIGTSSKWFHDTDWLDFNTIQSGHNRNSEANWTMVSDDYYRESTKPIIVSEPCYEDIPNFIIGDDWLNAYDTRKAAYWSLFAGSFGHTYGHNSIWQMHKSEHDWNIHSNMDLNWDEALDRPGAYQMIHVRNLMESRPFLTRIPDQSIVASEIGNGAHHIQATRDLDRTYAMVYVPFTSPNEKKRVVLNMDAIRGETVVVWLYYTRTGEAEKLGEYPAEGTRAFNLKVVGWDNLLVLDDAAQNYPAPGQK